MRQVPLECDINITINGLFLVCNLHQERLFLANVDVRLYVPSSAIDCQQEMGNRLHWTVRPIQPIILFTVVILWPNWVECL